MSVKRCIFIYIFLHFFDLFVMIYSVRATVGKR
nr:MAG TPA: hypothetical protein [Caudoviricetes sp.]